MAKKHSERAHALVSASGAHRWLVCTPSPRLEESFPEQEDSFYAKEGTLAHELAELEIRYQVGMIPKKAYKKRYAEIASSEYYLDEMDEEVDKYVTYVLEQYGQAKRTTHNPLILVEDEVDLTQYIPDGFGTNDSMVIGDKIMEVMDLKFGKGIQVSSEDNPQLKLYALGAYYKHELSYEINHILLTIVQPRLNNISTFKISVKDLLKWATEEVVPLARKAFEGEGELVPGDHCRWCRAKPRCRAFAEMNLEMVKHDFKQPELLSDEEVIDIHEQSARIANWLSGVSGYMLTEALSGKDWAGYKIVEGRSNRKWGDPDSAISTLKKKGYPQDDIINIKIKGIGAIEKLVGKNAFPGMFQKEVIKPQGKPTLATEDDKRPAMGIEQAKQDFKP